MADDPSRVTDRLTPASGVAFGDRARIRDTPLTSERGLAGRVGTVHGHTMPSLGYATDVIGASAQDLAVAISFDPDEPTVWIAAELVDFVDHGGAFEIVIEERRLTRSPDGSWTEEQS